MPSLPAYALASGLRGFASDSLRVKVTRAEGDYVWVVTADLQDAGTPLTLDRSQVVFEEEMQSASLQHKTGLVAFNESDCGGVWDGYGVVSDADPGL